jgi:hypothetical protein
MRNKNTVELFFFYSRKISLPFLLNIMIVWCLHGIHCCCCFCFCWFFQAGTSLSERYFARGWHSSLISFRFGRQNHLGKLRNRKWTWQQFPSPQSSWNWQWSHSKREKQKFIQSISIIITHFFAFQCLSRYRCFIKW